jgi:NAD(P)-dependent dehydrogenase (short-subunit alcohol dehydrogenase family)
MLGLSGKSAIVTGASRGIGFAITKALTELGVNVVGVGRKFPENWVKSFQNGKALPLQADVSKFESAEKAVEVCLDKFGKIDILVNNAGIVAGGTILDLKMEDWDRVMSTNLAGYLHFARVVAADMVNRSIDGRIVNVSSTAGIYPESGLLAYSTTKGAIITFTRSLAIDLARHHIRVNSVAPGWVDTQMGTGSLNKEQIELVKKRIPLGHIGLPYEIAGSVVFLASDLSRYMTGQTIVVDGGQTSDATIPGIVY